MILFLCYVCPPLAVLFMGRPFSAFINLYLTAFGWIPGVRHALVIYADRKIDRSVGSITNAINYPKWAQPAKEERPRRRRPRRESEENETYDLPNVGVNGTRFRKKPESEILN